MKDRFNLILDLIYKYINAKTKRIKMNYFKIINYK